MTIKELHVEMTQVLIAQASPPLNMPTESSTSKREENLPKELKRSSLLIVPHSTFFEKPISSHKKRNHPPLTSREQQQPHIACLMFEIIFLGKRTFIVF